MISFAAVLLGGLTKGITGFGYAVTGTALLASFTSPANAVVLMLPALIASNLELVHERGIEVVLEKLKNLKRFAIALVIGSVIGTFLIDLVPQLVLKKTVGVLVLLYIAYKQQLYSFSILTKFKEFCLRKSHTYQEILGLGSGLIFGASNIGVTTVALVENMEKEHKDFISLLSALMILTITSRFITAYSLGLYSLQSIQIATLLILPGLVGIKSGEKIRKHLPAEAVSKIVLMMLTLIALRLLIL